MMTFKMALTFSYIVTVRDSTRYLLLQITNPLAYFTLDSTFLRGVFIQLKCPCVFDI